VESAFQQKDVREKFLNILNQPRSKRQGFNGSGPTGQYGVHANGFEALMQLGSAVCNACMAQRDYLCAHALLQLTGKYYKVGRQSMTLRSLSCYEKELFQVQGSPNLL